MGTKESTCFVYNDVEYTLPKLMDELNIVSSTAWYRIQQVNKGKMTPERALAPVDEAMSNGRKKGQKLRGEDNDRMTLKIAREFEEQTKNQGRIIKKYYSKCPLD